MKTKRTKPSWQYIVFVVITTIVILACGTSTPKDPTATPVPPEPINTTAPTEAPTATPVPPTATPEPSPTPDYVATMEAEQAMLNAMMVAEVQEWLDDAGISLPDNGYFADLNFNSDSITVTKYQESFINLITEEKVADFYYGVDVTWSSTAGFAGCGLILRSEEKIDKGIHYQLLMMRLVGAPGWDIEVYEDGYYDYSIISPLYTKKINDGVGSTNRVIVVADGNEFSVYMNGDMMGSGTGGTQKEGHLGWMAWQDSGKTTCDYNNAWVYVVE